MREGCSGIRSILCIPAAHSGTYGLVVLIRRRNHRIGKSSHRSLGRILTILVILTIFVLFFLIPEESA